MSKRELDALQGVFREEAWATPLLALSVIVLCVLLLYTVLCVGSWIKPRSRATLLPWLQLPLLLGLMCMASTAIVAAVPFSDASCRMLFVGPGVSYVLLVAGLMSRINQQSTHIVLQCLLTFFVVLNQIVISAAYLASRRACRSAANDQLLMMLYPGLLIAVVLLLVYRSRHRKEAVNVAIAATFSGAFAACWLSAAAVLGDGLLSPCIGYGCLATAVVISLISLIPRENDVYSDGLYEKNIVRESRETFTRREPKPETIEPEIIIVPVTTDGEMLAENAIKVSQLHRLPSRRRADGHHQRRHHHHHHVTPRRERWHTKLRSEWTLGKRLRTLRKRKEPRHVTVKESANKIRTPYNHRGWLY